MEVYSLKSQDFNKKLYGLNVNYWRKRAGFLKAETFVDHIFEITGIYITIGTIYNIESGKHLPGIISFFAINVALFGELFPKVIFDECLPESLIAALSKRKEDRQ